jgi:hypothetical protein
LAEILSPWGENINPDARVIWEPQPGPQTHLIQCPVFEVFFGGARGGGKTEASIGDWLEHSQTWGEHANGLFVRKTSKQLEEVVARTKQIFPHIGAKFNSMRSEWLMPQGGRLKFRYLERDSDAEEYQGHSYTRLYVEEVTNFGSPEPINKLRGTLRSANGVPCGMRATGNPGGPGHSWVKARYIDPNPKGYEIIREPFLNPFTGETVTIDRVFIPSKISDNKKLMESDPLYVARLQQQGSGDLVKAWLYGDWDVVLGAFFNEFNPGLHVLSTADWLPKLPAKTPRFRGMDWGSSKPFSIGWYIVSDGTWGLPKGAVVKYREWYGMEPGRPNVGLKMYASQVARGILAREGTEQIAYGIADPSIFTRDGGPSIADDMLIENVSWRFGDRKRSPGWNQVRKYLRGIGDRPMLYFLDNCVDTIRTLGTIEHDPHNAEDLDTKSEDHAVDELRYALMSRPRPEEAAVETPEWDGNWKSPTINELVAGLTAKRRQRESMAI